MTASTWIFGLFVLSAAYGFGEIARAEVTAPTDPSCQISALKLEGTPEVRRVSGALAPLTGTLVNGGSGVIRLEDESSGLLVVEASLTNSSVRPDLEIVQCVRPAGANVLPTIFGDRLFPIRMDRSFARLGDRSRLVMQTEAASDYRVIVGGAPAGTRYDLKVTRIPLPNLVISRLTIGGEVHSDDISSSGLRELASLRSYSLYRLSTESSGNYLFEFSGTEGFLVEVGYLSDNPVFDFFGRTQRSPRLPISATKSIQNSGTPALVNTFFDIQPIFRALAAPQTNWFGLALPKGEFAVRIRSNAPDTTGNYRLIVRAVEQRDAIIKLEPPLKVREDHAGALAMNEALDWQIDLTSSVIRFRPMQLLEFRGLKGHRYQVTLHSDDFDALLATGVMAPAFGGDGATVPHTADGLTFYPLMVNDDHGTQLSLNRNDACLAILPLRDSDFAVKISSARLNQSGRFQIKVEEADKPCPK